MSTQTTDQRHAVASARIDARGPQFTAAVTAVVLVAVLSLPTPAATVLIASRRRCSRSGRWPGCSAPRPPGCSAATYARCSRAPTEFEDPQPPRFAQAVGLVFALVALVGFTTGVLPLALVATGFALVAALLNALFRFCLGCEMYLLIKRVTA